MPEIKEQVTKEPAEHTIKQNPREEGRKLQYDLFKHLTTLSTGSILLFVTFLEKLFLNPQWKILIAVAFGAFVLSILFSVVMMIFLAALVLHSEETYGLKQGINIIIKVSFACAGGGFVLGVLCLVAFALKNLYGAS